MYRMQLTSQPRFRIMKPRTYALVSTTISAKEVTETTAPRIVAPSLSSGFEIGGGMPGGGISASLDMVEEAEKTQAMDGHQHPLRKRPPEQRTEDPDV